jgi:hypothetical protein
MGTSPKKMDGREKKQREKYQELEKKKKKNPHQNSR